MAVLVRDHGLLGWLGLSAVAVTLFAAGFAIVAGPRAQTRRGRLLALGPAVLLTVGTAGALLVSIGLIRDRALGMVLGTVDAGWFGFAAQVEREQLCLDLLVPVLALALPASIVAVARTAGRGRSLGYAAALVSSVSGVGASVVFARLHVAFRESASHLDRTAFIGSAFAEASAGFDVTACVIAALAVLALSVALAAHRRAGQPLGRRATIGAGLVFVLGALAFAGTRGHAHDRRHRVSLRGESLPVREVRLAPHWMDGGSCSPLEIAPILELTDGDRARLDSRTVDAVGVRQDLETMRRNWSILHPREPFPGTVIVTAPPGLSTLRLRDWLSNVYAAHYTRAQVVFREPELVPTSTLGEIEVMHYCAVSLILDPCQSCWGDSPSPATFDGVVRDAYQGRITTLGLDTLPLWGECW